MATMRKIIIVDDSETFREGLKFFINNILGHKVLSTASNGEEFISLPNLSSADLILMDIEMPKMNGLIAARKVLEIHPVKIIAVSNYEDRVYLKELVNCGFKGFISKKNIHKDLANYIEKVFNDDFAFPIDLILDK